MDIFVDRLEGNVSSLSVDSWLYDGGPIKFNMRNFDLIKNLRETRNQVGSYEYRVSTGELNKATYRIIITNEHIHIDFKYEICKDARRETITEIKLKFTRDYYPDLIKE